MDDVMTDALDTAKTILDTLTATLRTLEARTAAPHDGAFFADVTWCIARASRLIAERRAREATHADARSA